MSFLRPLYTLMHASRTTRGIVLLVVLIGAGQIILWWTSPNHETDQAMRPLRANYRLINLHMWSYDVQGHPDFSLTAPRLERREGDDALYLTTPGFTLFSKKKGVPDWHGYASYGWVNHTGTLLKLQGQVHLRRAAYDGIPATALDSFDINVWPHQNRLETSAPAQMTQGERQMRGIGLRVNLDHHRMEWLNDSQGSFPPHKP